MNNYNTSSRKVQEVEIIDIPPHHTVYTSRQGKYAEVSHMAVPPKATIRKLDKFRYEVIATGEIRHYNLNDTAEKRAAHLRKSMTRLRGIIRANFGQDPDCERHITITYKSNMQDPERLMQDFILWYKRLQYHHKSRKFEYIAIAEPQERGAWHLHLLIKTDIPMFWDYNKLGDMWRAVTGENCGNPQIERIDADDVGAYFVAYFTTSIAPEIEASGNKEAIKTAAKAAKKGSRLHFYPPYFKFYRCSRGIVRPKPEPTSQADVVSEYGIPQKTNRYAILDDEGNSVQQIQKMTYKQE